MNATIRSTDAECGYLVDHLTRAVSRLDDTQTPEDFGCEDWAAVRRLPTDTLVDGHAWFVRLADAREYAASIGDDARHDSGLKVPGVIVSR